MSSPIKKIESLIDFLPEKDAKLAKKFLDTKNFEALRDLTTAVSVQLEQSILRGNIPDKYNWDFPMYEFNHIFSTEQTAQDKVIKNFYVGLKFTVLFGIQ